MKINQSYYQRRESSLACGLKIESYDRHKMFNDVCQWTQHIDLWKDSLSESIKWYLDNRKKLNCELDIDRKCRALGIPSFLTGINVTSPFLISNFQRVAKELNYKKTRSKIIRHDIDELGIYMKMYQEIELVKDKLPDYFPYGNPFEYIMKLMNSGAVIIRFKYVKIGNKKPVEKLVTYHTWGDLYRLAVHIEGIGFTHMKNWGEGDEKLLPLDGFDDIKIRWGINDFGKKGRFTY